MDFYRGAFVLSPNSTSRRIASHAARKRRWSTTGGAGLRSRAYIREPPAQGGLTDLPRL